MKNGLIIDEEGSNVWYLNDKYHREDGPAIEWVNGNKWWYLHGKLHRVDGAAEEYTNGNKVWFLNGEIHREDGPAVDCVNLDAAEFLSSVDTFTGKLVMDRPGINVDAMYAAAGRVTSTPSHEEVQIEERGKLWFLKGKELVHPKEFSTMEKWLLRLNNDEEYSYQWINDIKDLIGFINNPSDKQKRLHQMRWVL